MKELYTDIEIRASRNKVWNILMDFDSYDTWNPFIRRIEGNAAPGGEITVDLLLPGSSSVMTIKPVVQVHDVNEQFAWLGSMGIKGIFDGKHIFEVFETPEGCRFVHHEQFSGLLSFPVLGLIGKKTKKGFISMNEALKERAERD